MHNAAEGQVDARTMHAGALGQRMHPVRLQDLNAALKALHVILACEAGAQAR